MLNLHEVKHDVIFSANRSAAAGGVASTFLTTNSHAYQPVLCKFAFYELGYTLTVLVIIISL